jgi:hypothetical protein
MYKTLLLLLLLLFFFVDIVVGFGECSRFLLCMLLGSTFILIPGCHVGVALCSLSTIYKSVTLLNLLDLLLRFPNRCVRFIIREIKYRKHN